MKNYVTLGNKILKQGHIEKTRVGKTLALHNQELQFDLTKGFPLMTTKYVGPLSVIHELLWYLKGTTSIKYLKDNNVHVWDKFADSNDEVGKTYSYQFRNFNGIDQLQNAIDELKKFDDTGETNRRVIINLYNPSDLPAMSIPPCITSIQFNIYIKKGAKCLDSSIYQRSADFCLGVPYDIAEMALLTEIMAVYSGSVARNMSIFYSNVHVYDAHKATLKQQLLEEPKELPWLYIDKPAIRKTKPEELTRDMFEIMSIPENRKKFIYELF